MYHKARYFEYREKYDEAWKLYKKYVKKAKPSAEIYYHIGEFCASAIENGYDWVYSEREAEPSYWIEKARAMGYKKADVYILRKRFAENFPGNLLESAKAAKAVMELSNKGDSEAGDLYKDIVEMVESLVKSEIITDTEGKAVLGRNRSQFVLAKDCIEQNKDKESLGWIELSAENGNGDAQYMMANFYLNGSWDDLIKKDPRKAFKFYKKAAENGITDAEIALGELYYKGEGCEENIPEAAKWFAKAADNNHHPEVAHNAALCYYKYAGDYLYKKERDKSEKGKQMVKLAMDCIQLGQEYEEKAKKYGYKEKD